MTEFVDSSAPYHHSSRTRPSGATAYTPSDAAPKDAAPRDAAPRDAAPRDAAPRRTARIRDPRLADASLLLGALSVVAFWSFGVGIVLGLAALVSGALAVRVPDADRTDTTIGLVTAVVGIAAGSVFLGAVLPWF